MTEYNFTEIPNATGKVIDTITITSNEYLSFPTFFIKKHSLSIESAPALRMFYDKANSALGIIFENVKVDGLYKVNYSEKYGATCKIKSFLLNNELEVKNIQGKYSYDKIAADTVGLDGGDVYIVNLKDRSAKTTPGEVNM